MTADAPLPPADVQADGTVAAESCYCVCHSSLSSRAWCEHCKGDNAVTRVPRCKVPDESNANGTCARALPCSIHDTDLAALTDEELASVAAQRLAVPSRDVVVRESRDVVVEPRTDRHGLASSKGMTMRLLSPKEDMMDAEAHDEPSCDPTVDCKFVGPRDCPCRCHADALDLADLPERPSLAALLHGTEFDGMFRPDLRVVELDRSEREGTHGR